MSSPSPLLEFFFKDWQSRGFRITALRRVLAGLFLSSPKPLSIPQIQDILSRKKHEPNVTSIYREIDFFMKQGFLRSVHIEVNKAFYEFLGTHHHHIVCRLCGRIEDVDFSELKQLFFIIEKKLKSTKKFRLIDHSLEFFGICAQCS